MEPEVDGNTNSNWCARYTHQRIDKGTGGVGNKRTSGDHLNDGIIKISQRLEETCGHSNPSGKPSDKAGMKNSQMNKIICIHVKKRFRDFKGKAK